MSIPFFVSTPRQLAAIASPGREDIIDAISLIGACSASELARFLGRSAHSLYYHLRALRDCGLIVETVRSRKGARETAYYDVPARPMAVRFDLSTPARKAAVIRLVRRRLETGRKGVERACRSGAVTTEGSERDLWATHVKGWFSPADLRRANALFAGLIDLLVRGGTERAPKRQPYELTFALSPVRRTPKQRPARRPPTASV